MFQGHRGVSCDTVPALLTFTPSRNSANYENLEDFPTFPDYQIGISLSESQNSY